MRLKHGLHLAYCANAQPAASWRESLDVLELQATAARAARTGGEPVGLGLWLAAVVARELEDAGTQEGFRHAIQEMGCYVFTINGFPYGNFHGAPVKREVYRPDWTTRERLDHTLRLSRLLAALLPGDVPFGTVSTLPGSFKGFGLDDSAQEAMFRNLAECAAGLDRLREQHGRGLILGLEPEPLGWFETTEETISFFKEFFAHPKTPRCAREVIGVTYDCCHLAIEYEDPHESLTMLRDAGIKVAKIHLSSALSLTPTDEALSVLRGFDEPVYLHQVIASGQGGFRRFEDLPEAFAWSSNLPASARGEEWRVHFHVPLHDAPMAPLRDTSVLDFLSLEPSTCSHLEIETYTWSVLPEPLRTERIADQISSEYEWTLTELRKRGLAD